MRLPKCSYLTGKKGIEEAIHYFQKEKKTGYLKATRLLENKIFDGIIVFENGNITFSYLFYDNKEFFGDEALNRIMNIEVKDSNVDCFEMDKEAFELFRKYYPEARVTKEISFEIIRTPPKKPSREELLKKYKIRVPTEQEISNIILNFFEIEKLRENIKEEISKELSNMALEVNIDLLSHGYFLECDGNIVIHPENKDKIIEIKNRINEYLDRFSKKLGIDVKNSVNILVGGI